MSKADVRKQNAALNAYKRIKGGPPPPMSNVDFREYQAAFIDRQEDLVHHGIKGMKWGVRRYQNEDGSLTPAGKKRLSRKQFNSETKKVRKERYKQNLKNNGAEELFKKAIEYGEKHGLDLDDGGGGSEEAGRKYMAMWDQYEVLDNKAREEAKKFADDFMTQKYGQAEVEKFKRRIWF